MNKPFEKIEYGQERKKERERKKEKKREKSKAKQRKNAKSLTSGSTLAINSKLDGIAVLELEWLAMDHNGRQQGHDQPEKMESVKWKVIQTSPHRED